MTSKTITVKHVHKKLQSTYGFFCFSRFCFRKATIIVLADSGKLLYSTCEKHQHKLPQDEILL